MPGFFNAALARRLELTVKGLTVVEAETQLGVYAPGVKQATRVSVHDSSSMAEAALAVRADELLSQGWVPWTHGDDVGAALLPHSPFREWALVRATPAALKTYWAWGGALVERLLARVVGVEGPLCLKFGGDLALSCAAPLHAPLLERAPASLRPMLATHGLLQLERPDGRGDYTMLVQAGWDIAPPEGDAELDGSELEGVPVWWFLSRGFSQYWCTTGSRTFGFDFDGGLAEVQGDPAQLVLETILGELG